MDQNALLMKSNDQPFLNQDNQNTPVTALRNSLSFGNLLKKSKDVNDLEIGNILDNNKSLADVVNNS